MYLFAAVGVMVAIAAVVSLPVLLVMGDIAAKKVAASYGVTLVLGGGKGALASTAALAAIPGAKAAVQAVLLKHMLAGLISFLGGVPLGMVIPLIGVLPLSNDETNTHRLQREKVEKSLGNLAQQTMDEVEERKYPKGYYKK
jgi:hypothetical protein